VGKKDKINHLLIIRLSAMGDVAMLIPCVLAIIKTNAKLQITILTRKRFAPIFQEIPNVTIFFADVEHKHKGFIGLYRLYKELSKLQLDAVADTHNVLRSSILKLFFKFSGVPFIQIDKGRKEKKLLTQSVNKIFKPLKTTHQRYGEVFEKLGLSSTISCDEVLPKVKLPKQFEIFLNQPYKLIGIAPFAAHESKMYPLFMMEEVINKLLKDEHYKVLLFGGGIKEVKELDAIAKKFGEQVTSFAGKLSFEEELALISNLNIMLAMDSGNGHLAANYGVPVITLWGVTHPYAGFGPFGQPMANSLCADRGKYPLIPTSVYGNKFPNGYEKAMETISPESVCQAIIKLL